MFFTSENNETAESFPLQGLNPQEKALVDLRKILQGLVEDFGTVLMGVALHPMVAKQRDRCLRLGISVKAVNDLIEECRG
ncbi:hypothetical protein JW752_03615 [Candidatus Peregrinibacteria bacterium]|nr:hypothetical protein [Candidatus Peregrinibacteria bacterium]